MASTGTTGDTGGEEPGPQRSRVERFCEGLRMDFERWHDGVGCDLTLLEGALPDELAAMEAAVRRHSPRDARDVEALAAFAAAGSGSAAEALRAAFEDGDVRVRTAVLWHAPEAVPGDDRLRFLSDALATARIGDGLGPVLDLLREGIPPGLLPVLWREVERRDGLEAFHLAALLLVSHGHEDPELDPVWRPLLLRFNTPDPGERRSAVDELRGRVGPHAGPDHVPQNVRHRGVPGGGGSSRSSGWPAAS